MSEAPTCPVCQVPTTRLLGTMPRAVGAYFVCFRCGRPAPVPSESRRTAVLIGEPGPDGSQLDALGRLTYPAVGSTPTDDDDQ